MNNLTRAQQVRRAFESEDRQRLVEALQAEGDLDEVLANGNRLLHECIVVGQREARADRLLTLLEAGADPSARNRAGLMPEQLAMDMARRDPAGESKHEQLIELLQKARARQAVCNSDPVLRLRDDRGRTALHFAAEEGDCERIRAYLAAVGAHSAGFTDMNGNPPLFAALLKGQLAAAKQLIDITPGGWDATNEDCDTALHCAVVSGSVDAVEWVLDHRTDEAMLFSRDRHGCTAFMLAAESLKAESPEILARILKAAESLEDGTAQYALRLVRDWRHNGDSALLSAARYGNEGAFEALIKAGSRLDVIDNDGLCPLALAAYAGAEDGVRRLLEAGALPINPDSAADGQPLEMARRAARGHDRYGFNEDAKVNRRIAALIQAAIDKPRAAAAAAPEAGAGMTP